MKKVYKCVENKLQTDSEGSFEKDIQQLAIRERLARNLTQYQMADALGISQSTINRLESGKYKEFRLGFLLSVIERLGYTPQITFTKK